MLKTLPPEFNLKHEKTFTNDANTVTKYERSEITKILKDSCYHSPELSETDEENPSQKCNINIYDLLCRSDEVYLIYCLN